MEKKNKVFQYFIKKYSRIIPQLKGKNKSLINTSFNLFEVVVIVFISVLFGFLVGCILSYTKNNLIGTEVSPYVSEFISTYNSIVDNYYDKVDEKKLMDAAVSGMIGSLDDPYSRFMDTTTTSKFNETVDGEYNGIGVTVSIIDNKCVVLGFLEGSSAKDAGLKVNDVITKIYNTSVDGLSLEQISKIIKSSNKNYVEITVLRDEKEKVIKVKKGTIQLDVVTGKVIDTDNGIGYISISSFAANSSKQFTKVLESLEKKKIKSLIIDVRDNPGGHLTQVDSILSNFFNKKTVLYKIESKGKKTNIYSSTNDSRKYPIVILTNENSASASEILTACFKDNYKNVLIIGNTTYGKGTVQKAVELSSGSSYKYTTQKWLTAKNKWINGVGIEPTIKVSQSSEYENEPTLSNDTQLQKALESLKNETF